MLRHRRQPRNFAHDPAAYSAQVDLTCTGCAVSASRNETAKTKAIVAGGNRRSRFMPDLSTLDEEGGDPGLQGYFAAFAPGKTPRPIVERRNAALSRAIRTPRMQSFYRSGTPEAVDSIAEQFVQFTRTDRENAMRVLRSIAIEPRKAPAS